MYLLNLEWGLKLNAFLKALHSTMYLLNRGNLLTVISARRAFTFHNVSIKSARDRRCIRSGFHFTFHNVSIKSSMYSVMSNPNVPFTFHNVSIKSSDRLRPGHQSCAPLHSTVYLLNRDQDTGGI